MNGWAERVTRRNAAIHAAGQWRQVRALDGRGPVFDLDDGRRVVSFASNDYLGLSQHPAVCAAAIAAIERWGAGSGSARLVVGDRPPHRDLEGALAEWKGCEAAVLFPTGFAANLGVLSALGAEDVLIVSDELNHASIVDGCRLARAQVAISRHRDVGHVKDLLATHDGPAIVVTDVVFSMDGDVAPVDELVELCERSDALLVLDEAHAVLEPCRGLNGVVRVGTLSKTLGSIGGFVAGSRALVDLIVNAARPFVFTTAPTPGDSAAALAALAILRSDEGVGLLDRLRRHVERVAPGHPSPIIPVVVGAESAAVELSTRLLDDHGLLVPAIRPPTVAPGTSRLRIALSAAHTDEQIELLVTALVGC
ncbi:MAG: aminotransferase class I/II-fold pyridoxal phosphate-dependent enzyme [Acidimicrobiales bacterium]